MSYLYPTVTIGGNPYNVYGSLSDANLYLAATPTSAGQAWTAASDVTKSQALVQGTRWLDAATWQGTQTDATQALQWPRVGVDDLDPNTLPPGLLYGLFELAAALVENPDLRAQLGQPIARSLTAGSASITYFRPDSVFIASFFPPSVMSYVGAWLQGGGSGLSTGPIADGYGTPSPLDDQFGLVHGF